MKLAAMGCAICRTPFDSQDLNWQRTLEGEDLHHCDGAVTRDGPRGRLVLLRTTARQAQIDEDEDVVASQSQSIGTTVKRLQRRRELGLP